MYEDNLNRFIRKTKMLFNKDQLIYLKHSESVWVEAVVVDVNSEGIKVKVESNCDDGAIFLILHSKSSMEILPRVRIPLP